MLCNYSKKYLTHVQVIIRFLQSDNPRLQWAGLVVLAGISAKYSPHMQETYDVIPIFLPFLQSEFLKVKIQAVVSLRCYCQGLLLLTSRVIEQYNSAMSSSIYAILSSPSLQPELLSETLNLLAIYSQVSKDYFIQFADNFIIGIRNIIMSSSLSSIRASAVTCLSYIIEAINNIEYSSNTLKEFLGLMGTDDTIDNAIIESFPQFASSMQNYFFSTYGKTILSILFKYVSLDVGKNCEEKNSKIVVMATFSFSSDNNLNERTWSLNADNLMRKITACKCILMMTMLGNIFEPYNLDTILIMNPLLNYKYNKKIRIYAIKCLKELCERTLDLGKILNPLLNGIFSALAHPANNKNTEKLLELLHLILKKAFESSILTPDIAEKVNEIISVRIPQYINANNSSNKENCNQILKNSAKIAEIFLKPVKTSFS